MSGKKILVIGSGGREHALGWKLAQSEHVTEVIYSPGNAGTACEEKGKNIPVDFGKKDEFPKLFNFIKLNEIDMVVVGPEAPLCDGVVDYLNEKGYDRVIGPTSKAARLESDKFFSYEVMESARIPQALSVLTHSEIGARHAISNHGDRFTELVLKARGLTGGKGVSVFDYKSQAHDALHDFIRQYGEDVLVARRLYGQEFSVFGISDGNRILTLEMAVQDHKPLLDDNKGPNTGGMGAYCPVPIATREVVRGIGENIMTRVVDEMKRNGITYKGFLYAGMMMTREGPNVLEFNVRMGDPETQPIMMMLNNDLYEVLDASLTGRLNEINLEYKPGAACCVVLAAEGYPVSPKKGIPIRLEQASRVNGVKIFHAGTKLDETGNLVSSGGRVLGVSAYSPRGLDYAQESAYFAAEKILGFQYRKDIGDKGLDS